MELHTVVVRLWLYLEDNCTVRVLVEHVQDQVVEAHARFREVVGSMYPSALRENLMGVGELRALFVRGSVA